MVRYFKVPRPLGRPATVLLAVVVVSFMPVRVASASFLEIIPQRLASSSGDRATLGVPMKSDVTFQEASLAVSYDGGRFSVSTVPPGSLGGATGGSSRSAGFQDGGGPGIGEITTSNSINTLGNAISPGEMDSLGTFTLTVLATAPAIGGQVVREHLGGTIKSVGADPNGIPILLAPTPTGPDDGMIDKTILVGPEPATLILVGLGGVLATLTFRPLKKPQRVARNI